MLKMKFVTPLKLPGFLNGLLKLCIQICHNYKYNLLLDWKTHFNSFVEEEAIVQAE